VSITILKHNVPWGPFTRAQIDEGLSRGDFTLQYLAHAPGLKEWLPLGEVLHFLERKAPLPPVPGESHLPAVPEADGIRAKPLPPPLPDPIAPSGVGTPVAPPVAPPPIQLRTAPFFARAFAFLIDAAILFGPVFALFVLGAASLELRGWWERLDHETMRQEWVLLNRNFHHLLVLVVFGLSWFYAAGLESSSRQATIGKRWMGLKVTDAEGRPLGFLRATGRHWAKYLSALPCFLGFIAALFNSRGRALHDALADTRVVRT
jgi:uncharacterized RDD family membrane protein YckC